MLIKNKRRSLIIAGNIRIAPESELDVSRVSAPAMKALRYFEAKGFVEISGAEEPAPAPVVESAPAVTEEAVEPSGTEEVVESTPSENTEETTRKRRSRRA